ncbi:UDP-glycosyltransferase [Psychroflexus sp. CAK57W]|uniref:UDP-glycosyltransferase n=1 Tax=Psychroflexus curvus TaxID=2873595 RepID=UPI001CC98506|nr:UDP-glycosyltransferase [Psychroflexus curvus]MBZ9787841.1 UDP-glycosyltransferase [Psychroflexus curvus]
MKKILVLTDSIEVNDSSGAKANVALIKNIEKSGYKVVVLHYTRKKIELSGVNCISVEENKWNWYYWAAKTIIVFTRVLNLRLNLFFEKLRGFSFTHDYDVYSIKKALQQIDFDPDFIITLSKAASFRPHKALLYFPSWHDKWLAYIHDPYPFYCYPRPYDWIGPGDRKKQLFMQQVFEKAKYIGFPSRLLAEWMYSYYTSDENKIKIIPHQIDEQLEAKESDLPKDFNSNNINLVHAGALLQHRSPVALLKAFTICLKEHSIPQNTILWFVGGGVNHFENEFDKVKKVYLQNIKTLNQVDFKAAFAMQSFSDINIILESKSHISPFLPGKLPHLIKAKKPIIHIGPKNSEVYSLMQHELFYNHTSNNVSNVSTALINSIKKNKEIDTVSLFKKDIYNYFGHEKLNEVLKSCFLEIEISSNNV